MGDAPPLKDGVLRPSATRRREFKPVSGKPKLSLSKNASSRALALGVKLRKNEDNAGESTDAAKRRKVEVKSDESTVTAVRKAGTDVKDEDKEVDKAPQSPLQIKTDEVMVGPQLPPKSELRIPEDVIVGPQLPDDSYTFGPQLPEDGFTGPQLPDDHAQQVAENGGQSWSEVESSETKQSNNLEDMARQLGMSAAELQMYEGRRGGRRGKPVKIVDFNVDEQYSYNQQLIASGKAQTLQPVRSIGTGRHQLRGLISSATAQRESLEEAFAAGKRNKRESGAKYGF